MGSTGTWRAERADEDAFDDVVCEGCTVAVRICADGTVMTAHGDRGRVTYADAALRVWDCPRCQFTNAEDRFG